MIKLKGKYIINMQIMAGQKNGPEVNVILSELSSEMGKKTPERTKVRDILDRLKLYYSDEYAALSSDANSLVHEAENHLSDLKNAVEGMVVPGFILAVPEAKANMEKFGSIKNGVFIPENAEIKKDFEEYKDLMKFIEDTDRNQTQSIIDMEGLVSRYEKLLAPTNSRFIKGADYLTAMYGEALYEDLIARGFIYKRDSDQRNGVKGEYEIVCPKIVDGKYTEVDLATAFPGHVYLRLLKKIEVNDMMDMMAIGSIMTKDKINYRSMDLVGQDDMIQTILSKNNITGPDGKNILNAQLLLVHWETADKDGKTIKDKILAERKQIVTLANDGGSWQKYQELQYILDFMDNKDYQNTDRSLNMFQFANQYRKAFLGRQAYIDAGGPDGAAITDKNIFDHVGEFAEGNTLAALGVAFVAWFTGHNKAALFATIFGLMGGKFADAGSDALNGGKSYAKSWTKEQLGILDPQNVRYNIKTPDGISEEDVSPQLEKLFAANEGARKSGGLNANTTLTSTVSNAKIAKVYQTILKDDALLLENFSTSGNLSTRIEGLMGANPSVEASDFDSVIPVSELGPIDTDDILTVLTLMENNLKEEDDTSFGDVVYAGIDPLKKPFSPSELGFRGESADKFEANLNTILNTARTGATTRQEAARILSLQTSLTSIFVGSILPTSVDDAAKITQSSLFLNESEEAQEAIAKLRLITDANLTFGGVNYKAQLIDSITEYRDYNDVDAFLSEYDGLGAQAQDAANAVKGRIDILREKYTKIPEDSDKIEEALKEINAELALFADPTDIKVAQGTRSVDISTNPLYTPLKDRFDKKKQDLEQLKLEQETRKQAILDNITAGLNAAISGVVTISLSPTDKAKMTTEFGIGDTSTLQSIQQEITTQADAIRKGNRNTPTDLTRYINEYGKAYARLAGIQDAISGVTPSGANSALQQQIIDAVGLVLTTNGGNILFNTIEGELTKEFQKSKGVYDRVSAVTVGTTAADLARDADLLSDIQSDFETLIDGNFDGSKLNHTKAETAYEAAKTVFGIAIPIANSNITSASIYTEITSKQADIATKVKTLALDPNTSLDEVITLYNAGLVQDAHKQNESLGFKGEVTRKIEERVLKEIGGLGTADAIITYAEGDFKKAREVFEWKAANQPGEVLGRLDIDKKLAEHLETTLQSEITALTEDAAGLKKAKALAELMNWMPNESTLGKWSEIFGENFTEFTGLLEKDGVREEFDKKLEKIRDGVLLNTKISTYPRIVSVLEEIESDDALISMGLDLIWEQYNTPGASEKNTFYYTPIFKSDNRKIIVGTSSVEIPKQLSQKLKEAYQKEYLIK